MLNFTVHFNELKLKLYYVLFSIILTFGVSFLFAPKIINILSLPFFKFVKSEDSDFIFTSIFEVFNCYMVISFYSTVFFSIPLICYLFFTFIKLGLYKYERLFIGSIIKTTIKFIVISFLFTYFVIFPYMLSFLLNLDLITTVDFLILKMSVKLYDYIVFICKLFYLYCFIIFQIPTLFFAIIYFKHPEPKFYFMKRKIWIAICLIVGCIFSSPDLISLLIISVPLFVFYEFILFISLLKTNYKDCI